MGKGLCEASPAARRVFERADAALGRSISRLCFEGPESLLTLTANTQPAIVTVSIAALAALKEAVGNLRAPVVAAGHSLGEYSALVAAGALELDDAVKLVELRGQSMQEAVPQGHGAMAAIMGADAAAVSELCDAASNGEVLAPANFNAAGQIVIAGTTPAVERAVELAPSRKLKAILLKVSAPFHCGLMDPAARSVEAALSSVTVHDLQFPVIANVDAKPNQQAASVTDLLVRQVSSPVRWEQSMHVLAEMGVRTALEIGPGKVLGGLMRRINKTISVANVGEPQDIARLAGRAD
jgi:[acyl-carrier-protein] S-malonyltransferase